MEEQKNSYWSSPISDEDKSIESKSIISFGLNNATVVRFELNTLAGANSSPGNAIDFEVVINNKIFRRRYFEVVDVLGKDGNKITDKNSEEFKKRFEEDNNQLKGVITHIVKALGVSEEDIKTALSVPIPNFVTWARIMTNLPKVVNGYKVQIFLEYEDKIQAGNDRKWLVIPRNMKGGKFITSFIPGNWVQKRFSDGGIYYENEANEVHPITKSAAYMKMNKAKPETTAVLTSLK